jgi:hypothetical protein
MASAVYSSSPSQNQVFLALAHPEQLLRQLGARAFEGSTFEGTISARPELLKAWKDSRKQTPLAIEQRVYAKTVLSLIEMVDVTGGVTMPPQPDIAVPVARAPFAGPVVEVVRRRVTATRVAVRSHPPERWVFRHATALWSWAPWACTVLGFIVILGLTKHPDVLLVIPCRVVGLLFVYVNYACERFWARLETEVYAMFFGRSAGLTGTAGDPSALDNGIVRHGTAFPAQLPQQGPTLFTAMGWLCAVATYMRQP